MSAGDGYRARLAALRRALRQKLDTIDAALQSVDDAADPARAYADIDAMKAEALRDAAELHALEIHRRLDGKARLTTADRAALLVADRLLSLPDDAVDRKRWRISFPVSVAKEHVLTDTQQQSVSMCIAVCRRIASGEKPKKALPDVAVEFGASYQKVRAAYYTHRKAIEPLLKIERGDSV